MIANTYDGIHVTTSAQQPVIEVEIPFYVNSRFVRNNLVMNNTRGVQAHALRYETTEETQGSDESGEDRGGITYVERHVKPGADFSLFYLANVPHICMNASHIYPTSIRWPAIADTDLADCSYSKLNYRCGTRQDVSAYRTTSLPASDQINTFSNDNYFYDLSIDAQVCPLDYPPGNY